ncbi:hypothetical protein ATE49_00345 [Elizabethkingia miricola]|uniref:Uncharacterized protein n=1 Tax=Elizabethkingia miricola TaxID=172045 RepID=A0ABD5AZZ4_ELIMR|nr:MULTISPECIES: hypothetical protein [Elizabethkingia]MDQ8747077.1 hypothetical protein [Elizabethkingia miricola]NHQ65439.1 hypothetical protein [Elizabethkingia miricola]NHQ71310.1 hypothetical protein [Elizabethkingia miricola]NHQ78198.1 hypothetical protein [Elizabethkingia miricola]OBS13845.1 hypothetical protein ATE49_00345 [Elizabethkingia miricola]
MKKIILSICLGVFAIGWSQKKLPQKKSNLVLYSYQTFNCDNKGYYDPTKYKKEEIDGVHKLLYKYSGVHFDSHTVFKLSDLEDVRKNKTKYLEQLEQQYQEKKKDLYSLKIIDAPIWKKLREETIQAFEGEYLLNKTLLLAYSDPSILKKSKFYETCKSYVDAVTSPDKQKMYDAWKIHIEAQSKLNYDPKRIIAEFNNKLKTPQKDDYALIDLLGIGFHNCANNSFRPAIDEDGKTFTSFDKIFSKLKADCDEP